MSKDEILAMKPGRELDALVAEKVMGLPKPYETRPGGDWVYNVQDSFVPVRTLKRYSTDISAAWEVVEKMDADSFDLKIIKSGQYNEVTIGDKTVVRVNILEAICKAALLVVMES